MTDSLVSVVVLKEHQEQQLSAIWSEYGRTILHLPKGSNIGYLMKSENAMLVWKTNSLDHVPKLSLSFWDWLDIRLKCAEK